jgi:toxin ParE1/3/4
MRVTYHPGAEIEIAEAARFYEQQVSGLGGQFLEEYDSAVRRICRSPTAWRVIAGDTRRFLMARFPYGIYYRVSDDGVRILVLKHHSRHPDHGQTRT